MRRVFIHLESLSNNEIFANIVGLNMAIKKSCKDSVNKR